MYFQAEEIEKEFLKMLSPKPTLPSPRATAEALPPLPPPAIRDRAALGASLLSAESRRVQDVERESDTPPGTPPVTPRDGIETPRRAEAENTLKYPRTPRQQLLGEAEALVEAPGASPANERVAHKHASTNKVKQQAHQPQSIKTRLYARSPRIRQSLSPAPSHSTGSSLVPTLPTMIEEIVSPDTSPKEGVEKGGEGGGGKREDACVAGDGKEQDQAQHASGGVAAEVKGGIRRGAVIVPPLNLGVTSSPSTATPLSPGPPLSPPPRSPSPRTRTRARPGVQARNELVAYSMLLCEPGDLEVKEQRDEKKSSREDTAGHACSTQSGGHKPELQPLLAHFEVKAANGGESMGRGEGAVERDPKP
jgi:hypothetical protein